MRSPRARRREYEEFAAANADELVKLAYTVCRDRGRAEDAAQEALIVVFQRWSRLDAPLAYARRTAINATRADRRRAARTDRAHREAARIRPAPADDPHDRFLVRDALAVALGELPHGQRAVIALRYGSQLSEAETAATLDISIGTVKSQTAHALTRLRQALTPPEPATHELETA